MVWWLTSVGKIPARCNTSPTFTVQVMTIFITSSCLASHPWLHYTLLIFSSNLLSAMRRPYNSVDSPRLQRRLFIGHLISTISTPLVVQEWVKALSTHPDQAFAKYIHRGLSFGFRIGSSKLKSYSLRAGRGTSISAVQLAVKYQVFARVSQ